MKKESLNIALDTFALYGRQMTKIADYIDKSAFEKAVDAISKCGKIITCACGHSGIAAKHFAHGMSCIYRPGIFLSPAEAVHGGSGVIEKGDVALFVSRGGKTGELLPIMDIARKNGAIIITVTENLSSPMAEKSDIVLNMEIEKEADPSNNMGTTSFAVTVGLLDALWMAVLVETDYDGAAFATIHPGGAVGERLNK